MRKRKLFPSLVSCLPLSALLACGATAGAGKSENRSQEGARDKSNRGEGRAQTKRTVQVSKSRSLAGSYTSRHSIWLVCEESLDGCEEEVDDRLTITRHDARGIAVEIELVQANAHMCAFEGELVPQSDSVWIFDREEPEPCYLKIEHKQNGRVEDLILTSDGCREYCGARASLMASFPMTP